MCVLYIINIKFATYCVCYTLKPDKFNNIFLKLLPLPIEMLPATHYWNATYSLETFDPDSRAFTLS